MVRRVETCVASLVTPTSRIHLNQAIADVAGSHLPAIGVASCVAASVDHRSTCLVGKAAPRLDGFRVGDGAKIEVAPAIDLRTPLGCGEIRQPDVQLVAPAVDHLALLKIALMALE